VTLMQMYLWHKAASVVEGFHPMMTGFFRPKPRRDRRPGTRVEGRVAHLRRRAPEVVHAMLGYAGLLRELRALWIATTEGEPTSWPALLRTMCGPEEAHEGRCQTQGKP